MSKLERIISPIMESSLFFIYIRLKVYIRFRTLIRFRQNYALYIVDRENERYIRGKRHRG